MQHNKTSSENHCLFIFESEDIVYVRFDEMIALILLCLLLVGYGCKRVEENGENTQCDVVAP